jgi:enoyl-CoA hydratase/carnithine racemase
MIFALSRAIGRLYAFPRPLVGAINGHAVAGGLIFALTCDYRVGADGPYKLGLTEAKVGVPFPAAPLAVVQGELAPPAARTLALSARTVGPAEAQRLGVLDEVVPAERTAARALEVARELAALPRSSYGRIKRQLRAAALTRIEEVLAGGHDPLVGHWLSAETGPAAAAILRPGVTP